MSFATRRIIAGLGAVLVTVGLTAAAVAAPARFQHEPDLRGNRIVFVSQSEIWTIPLQGGRARALTNDGLAKSKPRLSPDGSTIAYTARNASGLDVYTIPFAGGTPRRLTWHPAADEVQGWLPDGKTLLITSTRQHAFGRFGISELFRLPATGGAAERLPIGKAFRGAISADGTKLAYSPVQETFTTWRDYRGGRATRLWLTDLQDYRHVEIASKGGNDTNPVWLAGRLYFLSDRDGSFGIYRYDAESRRTESVLVRNGHDMDWLAGDGETLVFAEEGYLWRLDLRSKAVRRIDVELPDARIDHLSGDVSGLVRSLALAPDGRTLVAEARGELFLKPQDKPAINITRTSGAAEREPLWSPDGRQIAYLSDASGEYEIYVRSIAANAGVRRLGRPGGGYPTTLSWSPDGRSIAYTTRDLEVGWVDVRTGKHSKAPGPQLLGTGLVWNRDGTGLFFISRTASLFGRAAYVDIGSGTQTVLTDGMAHVSEIGLSPDGAMLYVIASVEAGPAVSTYDESSALFAPLPRSIIYRLPLQAGKPTGAGGTDGTLLPAPSTVGRYANSGAAGRNSIGRSLFVAPDGTLLTLQRTSADPPYFDWYAGGESAARSSGKRPWAFVRYAAQAGTIAPVEGRDLDATRQLDDIASNDATLLPSAAANHLLFMVGGKAMIVDVGSDGAVSLFRPELGPLPAEIDLAAERRQMFEETARRFRDYFHDRKMNGADWSAAAARYRPWVKQTRDHRDLYFILTQLVAEVHNSHIHVRQPRPAPPPQAGAAGLLGADFEVREGRYVVTRVLTGSPWDVARSPLAQVGVGPGDTLVKIDGREIGASDDLAERLVGSVGKDVSLTIRPAGAATDRIVRVRPIASDAWLRQRDWIEAKKDYVEARSGGRIAYLYQPDSSEGGLSEFQRYFFPQADRDAIIVDERFNNGGADPDYQLDTLGRRRFAWYGVRGMGLIEAPGSMITGPMAMLVNAEAGSGGDLYPYYFKLRNLGRVIGTRTCGCVNGSYRRAGPGELVDGGRIGVPDLVTLSPTGEPIIENEGVTPEDQIDIFPADEAAGRDPQLDRAIDHLLAEIERRPADIPPAEIPSVDYVHQRPK